ncbi:hypothetical protein GGX14DRAFT_606754 [Mycena pura]|uniref:CCHC-type domain-containing protein n=1 Tax=Mycena pura TaxID=153505 RepID=A0AAD6YET7_9AGAR|nr:hypothetical protein GGX14DRAFT_606754 [Mycena pura]
MFREWVYDCIADFEQTWNMIGLEEDQEKVVKLWNSFRSEIQREMYRKDLDPEISSWDDVVKVAELAERLHNIDTDGKPSGSMELQPRQTSDTQNSGHSGPSNSYNRGRGGRTDSKQPDDAMHTSSVDMSNENAKRSSEKKISAQRRNEMLAKGLCFICEEQGHLARNCPKVTTMNSTRKGKPPGFATHAVNIPDPDSALLESTEILDTLPLGAINFGFEQTARSVIPDEFCERKTRGKSRGEVEEGGEPLDNFESNFFDFSDEQASSGHFNNDRCASGMNLGPNTGQPHPKNDDSGGGAATTGAAPRAKSGRAVSSAARRVAHAQRAGAGAQRPQAPRRAQGGGARFREGRAREAVGVGEGSAYIRIYASSAVEADVLTYAGWGAAYRPTGIFFDETLGGTSALLTLYTSYASYARTCDPVVPRRSSVRHARARTRGGRDVSVPHSRGLGRRQAQVMTSKAGEAA